MDGRNKQNCHKNQFSLLSWMAEINRIATKFCFKASLSATETLVLVQKAYGNEVLKQSNVFRWYSLFQDRWGLVEDDERGGHPKSTRTEVNIAAVADWSQMSIRSHQE
jgi:hypothetical protein